MLQPVISRVEQSAAIHKDDLTVQTYLEPLPSLPSGRSRHFL